MMATVFYVAVVKDRHGQQIFRHFGSDYERVRSELDRYLTKYEGEIFNYGSKFN